MSLGIEIGALASLNQHDLEGADLLEEQFEAVNRLLTDVGLPNWSEPTVLPDDFRMRPNAAGFPYSWLHYLRRAFAAAQHAPNATIEPLGAEDSLEDWDAIVTAVTGRNESHLLCHSDYEGYYVPVPFSRPLFAPEGYAIAGRIVGSSHSLLDELEWLAPRLGIEVDAEHGLGDLEARRLFQAMANDDDPWQFEHTVWLALYEHALGSIRYGTAIVFG